MNQMKEESQKHKRSDAVKGREIGQLRKDQRKKDSQIKSLEAEKRQKEIVLRRKQEEVEALRKRNKPMSAKVSGRVGRYERQPTKPATSEIYFSLILI